MSQKWKIIITTIIVILGLHIFIFHAHAFWWGAAWRFITGAASRYGARTIIRKSLSSSMRASFRQSIRTSKRRLSYWRNKRRNSNRKFYSDLIKKLIELGFDLTSDQKQVLQYMNRINTSYGDSTRLYLAYQIKNIAKRIVENNNQLRSLESRINSLEQRVDTAEGRLDDHERRIKLLEGEPLTPLSYIMGSNKFRRAMGRHQVITGIGILIFSDLSEKIPSVWLHGLSIAYRINLFPLPLSLSFGGIVGFKYEYEGTPIQMASGFHATLGWYILPVCSWFYSMIGLRISMWIGDNLLFKLPLYGEIGFRIPGFFYSKYEMKIYFSFEYQLFDFNGIQSPKMHFISSGMTMRFRF